MIGELREVRTGRQPQSLFDVARTFSRRVPLGRLVQIEPEIRPYMAALLVAAIAEAGDSLLLPRGLNKEEVSPEVFQQRVLEMAARDYKTFGLLQQLTANQPKSAAEAREERQRLAEE
jgi:hypothetical protein